LDFNIIRSAFFTMIPPNPWEFIGSILVMGVVACLLVAFKRIYLHPLSGIPGPRLAAATMWYSIYYEVWKDGELVEHLKYLHELYGVLHFYSIIHVCTVKTYILSGPVVRYRPNEVCNLHFFGENWTEYAKGSFWG
jgi:hypothetical protein